MTLFSSIINAKCLPFCPACRFLTINTMTKTTTMDAAATPPTAPPTTRDNGVDSCPA